MYVAGLKNDIDTAENTLKDVQAGEALKSAIRRRHLGDLEKSMAHIRKNGWEKGWGIELKEGEKLASRLRRLEKLKAEIMELKQSVISEIRSYGNPPPADMMACARGKNGNRLMGYLFPKDFQETLKSTL